VAGPACCCFPTAYLGLGGLADRAPPSADLVVHPRDRSSYLKAAIFLTRSGEHPGDANGPPVAALGPEAQGDFCALCAVGGLMAIRGAAGAFSLIASCVRQFENCSHGGASALQRVAFSGPIGGVVERLPDLPTGSEQAWFFRAELRCGAIFRFLALFLQGFPTGPEPVPQ